MTCFLFTNVVIDFFLLGTIELKWDHGARVNYNLLKTYSHRIFFIACFFSGALAVGCIYFFCFCIHFFLHVSHHSRSPLRPIETRKSLKISPLFRWSQMGKLHWIHEDGRFICWFFLLYYYCYLAMMANWLKYYIFALSFFSKSSNNKHKQQLSTVFVYFVFLFTLYGWLFFYILIEEEGKKEKY